MLKSLFILPICLFSTLYAYHITPLNVQVAVQETNLPRNEPLHLQKGIKINKGLIEHITLKKCKGVIDEATFKDFPKLTELTIWGSNIEEISTTLPITRMVVIGSHFPNLDSDLQQKLPKLKTIVLLGNRNFEVDSLILKNFKHLQALYVSVANFTQDCVTKDWFTGMMDLQELGLSDNGIDCIDDDAFDSLKGLKKLDLTYNHLEYVNKTLLKELTKLESLGLYQNDLTYLELSSLASQKTHLQLLGISWYVLTNSNISAEDLLIALPNLKSIAFQINISQNDVKAAEFCRRLRQKNVNCEMDTVFALAKKLGFSMLGSSKCKLLKHNNY